MTQALENKSILLIISGGIAAYKALELIRLIKTGGGQVRCILTAGGAQFVTPLSVAGLSGEPVYADLWSLKDESEMGHIRLSREADLIVVAPASADILAKMAAGLADDLATTTLLASDKPVMVAPAMNQMMWAHEATQENIRILAQRGVRQIGPNDGDLACGETGSGRMAEAAEILEAIKSFFLSGRDLAGRTALVTSGPTLEPLDPVRFLGNRSSGKQGHAIAAALAARGATVKLVSGPVALHDPAGVKTIHVETAAQMLAACRAALPADIAVCAAAVADWAPVEMAGGKIKKRSDGTPPVISLKENPDILTILSQQKPRPRLVIGFAAETSNLLPAAREKRLKKGCDWMMANEVGTDKIFGADETQIYLITGDGQFEWRGSKRAVAEKLADAITAHFGDDIKHRTAAE